MSVQSSEGTQRVLNPLYACNGHFWGKREQSPARLAVQGARADGEKFQDKFIFEDGNHTC
jgi:hypothetical protein